MREGSSHNLSTANAAGELRSAAKSLFRKILPLSPYGSRFYPDLRRSTHGKFLRMRILRNTQKKLRATSHVASSLLVSGHSQGGI
jgi:hypothetical protein